MVGGGGYIWDTGCTIDYTLDKHTNTNNTHISQKTWIHKVCECITSEENIAWCIQFAVKLHNYCDKVLKDEKGTKEKDQANFCTKEPN